MKDQSAAAYEPARNPQENGDPTPGQPVEWVVSWCPTCLESTTWPVDLWIDMKPRDRGHEHALAAI